MLDKVPIGEILWGFFYLTKGFSGGKYRQIVALANKYIFLTS